MGYCNVENYSAVFRAISPSNNILSYQESCPELKISSLNRILRPHYKEKDGMSTFTKLCNTLWSQSESCIDCCKTDVFETGLYPCHWGGLSLWCKRQKWFLRVLETGIRNGNFRNELHPLLKNSTITDEELLGCVTFAGSNESEWSEKFSNKKKIFTSIFSIDEQHQNDNPLHLQIQQLELDHNKKLKFIHSEMKELRKAMFRTTGTYTCTNSSIPSSL